MIVCMDDIRVEVERVPQVSEQASATPTGTANTTEPRPGHIKLLRSKANPNVTEMEWNAAACVVETLVILQ